MPNANLVLFEDHFVDQMRPITLTRPAFSVTGPAGYRLEELVNDGLSVSVRYVVRDYLKSLIEQRYTVSPIAANAPTLFVNASLWPDVRYSQQLRELIISGKPMMCTSNQRIAVALVGPDAEIPDELSSTGVTPWLLGQGLPLQSVAESVTGANAGSHEFKTLDYPFHLIPMLYDTFEKNIAARIAQGNYREIQDGVFVGENVSIGEYVVFHAEKGPIVIDNDVTVLDFNYFQGPLYIGPRSRVIERSSIKEFTSVGQTCKVGGEVEASIIESYSNKQHHGFLGHSYVGSWVNLGAGTSNSDLKNSYGKIRVELGGRRVDTGLQFFGCVIGDYSKSAINTSIFTGKIIGVNSMLYGYVGQNVPSFTNYAKSFGQVTECSLDAAIAMQRRMFGRRKIEQTEDDIAILRAAFEQTREERTLSSTVPVL